MPDQGAQGNLSDTHRVAESPKSNSQERTVYSEKRGVMSKAGNRLSCNRDSFCLPLSGLLCHLPCSLPSPCARGGLWHSKSLGFGVFGTRTEEVRGKDHFIVAFKGTASKHA